MNIRVEYSALVSAILMDWKNENTNLAEVILQIIRHFEFMERNKKANIMQTTTPSVYRTPKRSYTNNEYVEKDLTTYYADRFLIKLSEFWVKYAFGQIHP